MAEENQLEFEFPDPDEFESFDDKNAEEVEAGLPEDSFEEKAADFESEGCGCVK